MLKVEERHRAEEIALRYLGFEIENGYTNTVMYWLKKALDTEDVDK